MEELNIMKNRLQLLAGVALLFLSACQTQPSAGLLPTGTPNYLTVPPDKLPASLPETYSPPISMKIGYKTINVDQVVEGPLCNGTWSGTVFVTSNVQVYQWEEQPTFLKNCSLTIAPGTVVYVAYHHDTAYYNGCSCHTGETAGP
jgi:hypothetical protein